MDPVLQAASRIDAASSTVILRPRSAAAADAEWKRALVDDPATAELLGVCPSTPPSAWYERWCDALGTEPAAAAAITTPELADGGVPDHVEVETVATPSNLTGIGVKTTPFLSRWDDAVAVVEPLSVLFQYAGAREVYQFIHVLLARARTGGGDAQVYMDPNAAEERTVERLKTLFDAVVEYDGDADGADRWDVRARPR